MTNVTVLSRRYGFPLMFILPVFILVFILWGITSSKASAPLYLSMPIDIAGIFWFFLLLDSLLITSSGYTLSLNFNKEINRLQRSGFPIRSVEGFQILQTRIRNVYASSFLIFIAIFISFMSYLGLIVSQIVDALLSSINLTSFAGTFRVLLIIIGFGLILIAIGIALLLSLPEKPALVPGALMKYYSSTNFPSQLDNFLTDAIFPFLDPVTRTRWGEWTQYISDNMNPAFSSGEDQTTRTEVAREKILLLAYLSLTMPETMNETVLRSELSEILKDEIALEGFFQGKNSNISWIIIKNILQTVKKTAPEIFQVVDRIIVELTDNLAKFKQQDLWITVAAPNTVLGNIKPFRILVFMLNRDSENWGNKKRPVKVKNANDAMPLPDEYKLRLDEAKGMEIKADKLPFTSSGEEDIIGVLSKILQTGDAVWIQAYRKSFGNHLFNIRIEEEGKDTVFGTSLTITVKRNPTFYVQAYGGRLSALSGAVLPVIGIFFTGLTGIKL